ncbi:MAG TPA: SRPBCC family protein, partial [Candidatus Dormibacteraeota bacterium]
RILIDRPVAEVYAFAADLRNEPKWDPLVLSIDRMTDGTDRIYRGRQRLLPHLVLDFQTRAQEEPEDRVIRYTVLGKWFPERAEWRFTPARDGTLVTIVRWFELGPMRAIAYGVARYRNGLRAMTIRDLNRLRRVLTNEEAPEPKLDKGPREVVWQYKLIKMIPGIRDSDIGITIATFLACWLIYSWPTSEWFATGLMVMLLIHELGHYVEGRRLGFKPRPPVFILGGAFVYLSGVRLEPLNNARVSFAGALAGGAATAVALALSAAGGWTQLLPWVAAGAAANLFGSMLPFITVDVESILHVVGRWLPLVGVFAAGCAWLATTALGIGDLLIPSIVALAFVVLALRYPGGSYLDGGALSTKARLVLAASWLAMLFYLSIVFILAAGWLY